MKKVLFATIALACLATNTLAKNAPQELTSGYFMVLAAYAPSAESYAIKYVNHLKTNGIEANYGYSASKNLLFVYSKSYSSRSEAIASIRSERERTGENKAWVYVYKSEGIEPEEATPVPVPIVEIKEDNTSKEAIEVIKKDSVTAAEIVLDTVEKDTTSVATPVSHQGKTYLYIEAYDAQTGKPVVIDFNVIDLARKKLVATAPSQGSFALKEPTSASKMIQVSSNDIGWQKQSFDFKYYEPIIDSMSIFIDNLGDTTFVKFEMTPIRKGQFVTLYQVFFYKDAAIMQGKSAYELDQVVAFLNNNPKDHIIIHGHTNGNAAGKIIALKDGNSTDYFKLTADHREIIGSAKELSFERAKAVGAYLKDHGIDPARFEAKGWGGKKMIYDKHSLNARYNVRVEIEVVGK